MSKETKFTSGEWKVQDSAPSDGNIRVTCSSNRNIAIVTNSTSKYFSVYVNRDIFNNSLANAHLIKAAPKLYEALEEIYNEAKAYQKRTGNDVSWIEKADKLLAEARGE